MARILVIDDDASLLQMMSLMLKRAGHDPILATNGQEGINIARGDQPALAIVDVMMPELNGYEVCRILREDSATAHIPLLVLTALSQPEQREMASEAGADDFVTKPVTRDDLVTHVDDLLETGPRNAPAPLREQTPPPQAAPSSAPAYQTSMPPVAPPQPSRPPAPLPPIESSLPTVAVMGLGSGVGTTTIAVNLALSKMYAGRACLVDLNTQVGRVAMHLRMMPPRATWQNLLNVAPGSDKRVIGGALMVDQQTGLAIVAGPTQPTSDQLSEGTLTYVLQVLSEGFPSIVLDLPPIMSQMNVYVLRSARSVVLVVGDDPAALMSVRSVISNIESLGLSSPLNLVLNHTRPHGISSEDLMNEVGYPLTANVPYEPDQVAAVTQGQPLAAYKPDSLFARTLQQLARQV
jgi:CheY-like chemotaxis protein